MRKLAFFAWALFVVLWMLVALVGVTALLALIVIRLPLKWLGDGIESLISAMLMLVVKARPSTDRWEHIEVRP
jgi:hypothetical protein